jgi:hypothetical protein
VTFPVRVIWSGGRIRTDTAVPQIGPESALRFIRARLSLVPDADDRVQPERLSQPRTGRHAFEVVRARALWRRCAKTNALRWLEIVAHRLVREENWTSIGITAAELIKRGTLTGDEVTAIVNRDGPNRDAQARRTRRLAGLSHRSVPSRDDPETAVD